MILSELPEFLQDRFKAMKPEVREALLSCIDQGWVDCQVAAAELVKGLDEGKWTIEDIQNAVRRNK